MELMVMQSRCQGHGMCAGIAADIFLLDDDGYIDLDGAVKFDPADVGKVEAAVLSCPEAALELSE